MNLRDKNLKNLKKTMSTQKKWSMTHVVSD